MTDILKVTGLSKVYPGKVTTRALTDIGLTIQKGEFVGVMGPSGSGKTTLLNMVSTIDTPSSGTVLINGSNPHEMKKKELALFRRRELGFVFQDFNLLDTLTVAENIVLPLTLDKQNLKLMEAKLDKIAERLGIADILNKRVYEISGGQRQRAAIARAIIPEPSLLLADEPTGALDSNSSRTVMQTLENLNETDGVTMMLVTHDAQAASYCHRVVFIKDGVLSGEIRRGDSRQAFFQKIIDMLSYLGGHTNELSSVRV
ncbi:ATP-binding cassette domain-containing protein [Paenibacillus sp. HJL G12]|uniref:ATP-binding cassette domain-containing protein n=1 Tax=Paenibacillus dendrobii TaxID=2691084 RepID=A0A7X3IFS9_9BACL|nr:ABC transporter ATP-binding protein [Paenibacillus dendrobii]MWV43109.1 ATP-binding cassette domain-containing protein [Paenibacillus dendrobii]